MRTLPLVFLSETNMRVFWKSEREGTTFVYQAVGTVVLTNWQKCLR